MKTSHKMLITTAGVLIALLVTGLLFLRREVQTLMSKTTVKNYERLSVGDFSGLDFSSRWVVEIRQGREYKLEVASDGHSKPFVENIRGTLYLKRDTTSTESGPTLFYAKIMAPSLKKIKSGEGTKIEMKRFQSDTLTVILDDNSEFTGNNNRLKYSSYETKGNALLEIIDDEM